MPEEEDLTGQPPGCLLDRVATESLVLIVCGEPRDRFFNHKQPNSYLGLMGIMKFCEFFTHYCRHKVSIVFESYVENLPGKTCGEQVIAGFPTTTMTYNLSDHDIFGHHATRH